LLPEVARSLELVRRTAAAKAEEGRGHGRSVCPETPGPHAGCNGKDNGSQPRKSWAMLKPYPSCDGGLQPALTNLESLVTAGHHRAVNTSLLLAHTARRFTEVGPGRGGVKLASSNLGSATGEKS